GRPTDQIRHRALHGLSRALISNMVKGVTEGYKKEMELVGVGFKAANQGNTLDLSLGYSHNIIFDLPKEIKVSTAQEKGKNPTISLESNDKQLLGQVCAKLRSLRKPEPYKGKGVKFAGEVLRRKAGKAAGK
ncbi:MAG TPA: 50S ribosomal protein L6, partial [Ferruginibacter sp.]|nr:50S ribosomal protein L6 [Ferruginibacter sp.]